MIVSLFLLLQPCVTKYVFPCFLSRTHQHAGCQGHPVAGELPAGECGRALQWVWRKWVWRKWVWGKAASPTLGASYPSKQPDVLLFLRRGPPLS